MQTTDKSNPTPAELKPVFRMHAEFCKALVNEHRQALVEPRLAQGQSPQAAELLDAERRQPTAPPTSLTPSSPAASASAPA
jgi:hypothetical protein